MTKVGEGDVIIRSHGFALDHIALAVGNVEEGAAHVESRTGARPYLAPPEPDQWYWSAGLPIGEESLLEIIGPNPNHRGPHPLKSLLRRIETPQLMFWYVAAEDFAAFSRKAKSAGAPIVRVERVGDASHPDHHEYVRGMMGRNFLTQRPSVIQWIRRAPRPYPDKRCVLSAFALSHPKPEPLNRLFEKVGVPMSVSKGPDRIAITLDTPKGEIVFDNPGYKIAPLRLIGAMAKDLFR